MDKERDDWMKPSPVLKRMAEAKVPDQFKANAICTRGHYADIECGADCRDLYAGEFWEEYGP